MSQLQAPTDDLVLAHNLDFKEVTEETLLLILKDCEQGEVYLSPSFTVNLIRMHLAERIEKQAAIKRNAQLVMVGFWASRMCSNKTPVGQAKLACWEPLQEALREAGYRLD